MRRVAIAQRDRRAANQAVVLFGKPDPSPCVVIEDVLGNRPRNIGLELQTEARQRLIDFAVQGDDAAEIAASQVVSYVNWQVLVG